MGLIEVTSNWSDEDVKIDFVLGNLCNYSCWYCFPGSHEGTHRFPDFDLTVRNLTHLINVYKANGKKRIFLNLLGGEPSLWPRLADFAKIFSEQGCEISMITNASRTLRWWEENAKYFSKINISCHHEKVDVEHIKAVGDIIYDSGCIVDASVLMDPFAWNKCKDILYGLKKSKRKWVIIAQGIVHETVNYTDEQKKFISKFIYRTPNLLWFFKHNKHKVEKIKVRFENGTTKKVKPNWLMVTESNHFKGWLCNIGIDYVLIEKDGTITGPCYSKLFNLNFYFNLYQSDFLTVFSPQLERERCNIDICPCQPATNLKKFIPVVPISLTEYPLNKYSSS